MTAEIISWSIYEKERDQAGMELAMPESAVRLASISQLKHMLWELKRTVSMKQFFWAPKTHI